MRIVNITRTVVAVATYWECVIEKPSVGSTIAMRNIPGPIDSKGFIGSLELVLE
jgi:hypothetical protein